MREEGCPINFAAGGKPISVPRSATPAIYFPRERQDKTLLFFREKGVAAGIQDKFLIWQWFFAGSPPSRKMYRKWGKERREKKGKQEDEIKLKKVTDDR